MKERGEEPTYPKLGAANPTALLNPETDKPVGKKRVFAILRRRCYDDPEDPEDTWEHRARSNDLSAEVEEGRVGEIISTT